MLPIVDRPLSTAVTFGSTCSTTAALLTTLLTARTVCAPESSVVGRLLATTTTSTARPSGSPSWPSAATTARSASSTSPFLNASSSWPATEADTVTWPRSLLSAAVTFGERLTQL